MRAGTRDYYIYIPISSQFLTLSMYVRISAAIKFVYTLK